jgi:sugar/nucleoside kinase (ribokinase family)
MEKKVLVIGELNVDLLLNKVKGFPVLGQEIMADAMTLTLGSSAAIFAANLASLGVSTAFCGMLGNDMFGHYVLDELRKRQVDTTLITQQDKYQTGITVVLNYEQDRANVTHGGAMEFFSLNDIAMDRLGEYRHLHFSSYFLQKALQKDIVTVFKIAKDKGLTTSLDLQWDPENKWNFAYKDCLPYVDYFLPNEAELLALTGTHSIANALALLDPVSNTVVVKRGMHGALAYNRGEYTEAPPFLHNHFVDAIGAGDSFNAGFVSSLLHGKNLQDSLIFGNLTGAINTTAAGGTGAFPDRAGIAATAKTIFQVEI